MLPASYWPRTMSSGASLCTAASTLDFSSRTASASNEIGASIATIARSCMMWFGTMSRSAPVFS